MNTTTQQAFGWYGVIAILVAYALVSLGWLSTSTSWYQVLNFTGAIAIAYVASTKKDRQPMVLNIIWALVALIALARLWAR